MSHYKPYPAYKESGVEWLGRVPEHWQQMPLKRLVRSIEQGWSPECESWPANTGEWGVLKVGCVNGGSFRPEENKALPVTLEPRPELAICKGDVLVSRANTRELVGSCVPVSQDYPNLLLCDKIYRLRAGELVTTEFLAALITVHGRRAVEVEATGASSSMLNISQSVILDLPVALPASTEQVQIIAATSRETARIDALIEKKTRFIELLREKRQALITHAVTKGLDPNVKMKDSGVEWLGEVPEHWVVSRLRHNIDGPLSYGANEAAESDEPNDPRFIRITDLHEDGTLREDTFKSLPWSVAQPYLLSDGDVLLARSGATVGKSFIYRESMGPSCYAGYLIRARLLPSKLISQYFWLCTQSTYYWDFIAGSNIQATIQNVSGEKYANLWLAVPPIKEQQRIINFLEEACDRLDSVRVKTERSIELLKERRSALITAAVTGQIDLREAV